MTASFSSPRASIASYVNIGGPSAKSANHATCATALDALDAGSSSRATTRTSASPTSACAIDTHSERSFSARSGGPRAATKGTATSPWITIPFS